METPPVYVACFVLLIGLCASISIQRQFLLRLLELLHGDKNKIQRSQTNSLQYKGK